MKKRNIIIAIAAMELLTLPAAAHILSDIDFGTRDHVIASKVPLPATTSSSFLVNSNSAFTIIAQNAPGDIRVRVIQSGAMGPVEFGNSAQMPGPAYACNRAVSGDKFIIYESTQGTESGTGEVVDQAVFVTIDHPSSESSEIKFLTRKAASDINKGESCTQH